MKRFDPIADALADPRTAERLRQELAEKLEATDLASCWPWRGPANRDGYGRLKAAYRIDVLAHRVAWALANGHSPGDALILHRCDNPQCCNPAHLYAGDNARNVADRVERGRTRTGKRPGELNPAAKLTARQVAYIRKRIAEGATNVEIADQMPVGHAMISRIRREKAWVAG